PLVQRPPGFLRQLGDPLLHHRHPRMNAVERLLRFLDRCARHDLSSHLGSRYRVPAGRDNAIVYHLEFGRESRTPDQQGGRALSASRNSAASWKRSRGSRSIALMRNLVVTSSRSGLYLRGSAPALFMWLFSVSTDKVFSHGSLPIRVS